MSNRAGDQLTHSHSADDKLRCTQIRRRNVMPFSFEWLVMPADHGEELNQKLCLHSQPTASDIICSQNQEYDEWMHIFEYECTDVWENNDNTIVQMTRSNHANSKRFKVIPKGYESQTDSQVVKSQLHQSKMIKLTDWRRMNKWLNKY